MITQVNPTAITIGIFCSISLISIVIGICLNKKESSFKWWYPLAVYMSFNFILISIFALAYFIGLCLTWAGLF